MAVTIKDIAKVSGFSLSTVSRVLSGHSEFYSEKTAKKIKKIAHDLNYQKNASAVELVTKKSKVIAVIISSTKTNFSNEIIDGIEDQASMNDCNVIILYAGESDPVRQRKALQTVIERSVMGILLVAVDLNIENTKYLSMSNIPYLFISISFAENKFPFISSNNFDIAYHATKYLIEKKHKRIALVALDLSSYTGKLRLEGYEKAMSDYNLPINYDFIYNGNFTYDDGEMAMKKIGNKKDVTAVIASSDLSAMGVINQAEEMNLEIPNDLSVVSLDGTNLCNMFRPTITSFSQSFYQMGVEGVKKITSSDLSNFKSFFTPFHFVERRSS
ncbi:LacI family DNA-binding transcriptional regulator [Oenococcus alcoholitolerans]|uniref:LacI family DNA-binding transcriptional regulator n=1 Tax=Oenococcus alcoholitolerans TaxID=931074 RepID=UPI003F70CB4E